MIIDIRELPPEQPFAVDICIVGSGPAGITLARELKTSKLSVCLVESGGLSLESDTQRLYAGSNVGLPYVGLDAARLRYLGGTSNHWTGQCRPLDPIDFEQRDWVPYSGWPFDRAALDPYYARAQVHCQLGSYRYAMSDWAVPDGEAVPIAGLFENALYQFSPPTRFAQAYRADLDTHPRLTVLLHANALELLTDEQARQVQSLEVASLDGRRLSIVARAYVLAMGGIENARLLLLSNGKAPNGLGNEHDLVGRFFMEHPEFNSGYWLPAETESSLRFYGRKAAVDGNPTPLLGLVKPTDETLRRHRLLSCAFRFSPVFQPYPRKESSAYLKEKIGSFEWPEDVGHHMSNLFSDLDAIADASIKTLFGTNENYFDSHPPYERVALMNFLEPSPNPDSRVTLGDERDALGQRRVRLDWRLNDLDRDSLLRVQTLLGQQLGAQDLGRLKVELAPDSWPTHVHWGYHHMGTTRMHHDPRQGVCDPNSRVHGCDNLFVAGSSLFPTAGFTNPTLTIVALAAKLGDHLAEVLA